MTFMLTLAAALGGLTYVLGALLYALPLPLKGVKRWAPVLITDGIVTVILAATFGLIMASMNYIFVLMGMNREELIKDIWQITENIARMYVFLITIKSILKTIFSISISGLPLGKILSVFYNAIGLLAPLSTLSTQPLLDMSISLFKLATFVWASLYALAEGSATLSPFLIAVGTVMVGIPFRLSRSAGAFLIGFGISSYVVTPLIVPLLRALITYNPTLQYLSIVNLGITQFSSSTDVFYPYGKIYDAKYNLVTNVYVAFCDGEGRCGFYPVDSTGSYTTALELGGAPWPKAKVYLDVYGVRTPETLLSFDASPGSTTNLDIQFLDVYMVQDGIAVVSECARLEGTRAVQEGESATVYIRLRPSTTPCNATISVFGSFDPATFSVAASSEATNVYIERTTWAGEPAFHVYMTLKGTADVALGGKPTETPSVPSTYLGYMMVKLGLKIEQYVEEGKLGTYDILMAPFMLTVLPSLHLMVVWLVARGIASLISGSVKLLLTRVW